MDDKHNYVVLHPDFLISATTVADTISCLRKSVLQERVKATSDISKPLVYGNILHALFQSALEAHDFSIATLEAFTKKILMDYIQDLFILREEVPVATEYVRSKFGLLQDWAGRFIGAKPKACYLERLNLAVLICSSAGCRAPGPSQQRDTHTGNQQAVGH